MNTQCYKTNIYFLTQVEEYKKQSVNNVTSFRKGESLDITISLYLISFKDTRFNY